MSHASWITILTGASRLGNGTINYSVAAYSGPTSRTGTLTIADQVFTVTQAGSSAAPVILVEPTAINFGNVPIETQSSATVKVTNAGNTPLLIYSISLLWNIGDFGQTNNCTTVAPGSSCDIKLYFSAVDPGPQKVLLAIQSNDPAKGSVFVPVTGSTVFSYRR